MLVCNSYRLTLPSWRYNSYIEVMIGRLYMQIIVFYLIQHEFVIVIHQIRGF